MKIKVLGAHNTESRDTRCISLLVDNVIAIDAGCLTSSLTFEEQTRLKAVLLTHGHYDHIRDIPALAINLYLRQLSVNVFSHPLVFDNITRYFLNGDVYSEFHKNRAGSPASLNLQIVKELQPFTIGDYRVIPVPVKHAIATMGYQVTAQDGRSVFYSGDTGNDLHSVWSAIAPQLLVVEVTASNQWRESSLEHGHLTPQLLKPELIAFRQMKGYFPKIVTVHMNPADESRIRLELAVVAGEIGASIELAYEGMSIEI